MFSGKPTKSASMNIAYAIKKKNSGKYPTPLEKNYAKGGMVQDEPDEDISLEEQSGGDADDAPMEAMTYISPESIVKSLRAKRMAAGGEVNDDFLSDEENTALPDESMEDELPQARRKRMLSKAFEMVRQRHTRIQE